MTFDLRSVPRSGSKHRARGRPIAPVFAPSGRAPRIRAGRSARAPLRRFESFGIERRLAELALASALLAACAPSPPIDSPSGATGSQSPPDDAADGAVRPDVALLHGGSPSGAGGEPASKAGMHDARAVDTGRASEGGHATSDAADARERGAPPASDAPSDAAPDSDPFDAVEEASHTGTTGGGAGVLPLDCASARLCWHRAPSEVDSCIARVDPAGRSDAEALRACERSLCAPACDPQGPVLVACNDCVLRLCPAQLERCARASGCGDGVLAPDIEQCDDGNDDPSDGCTNACTIAHCGDSVVASSAGQGPGAARGGDPSFDGSADASAGASATAAPSAPSAEECDDGNADERDDCLSDCRRAACGDGWVRLGIEACDDGNIVSGDGCSPTCMLETCGNGVVDPGEECDDGGGNGDENPCLPTCAVNRCGDGKRCSNAQAGCGSRYGTLLESCDDGNRDDADACLASCRPARCGDGIVQAGREACDDGNDDPFDGCTPACLPAAGHLLITEIVARPAGAEMIEIHNPTDRAIDLSAYAVSDSADYYLTATGAFVPPSADFAARFPDGSSIGPHEYRTIAIGNGAGGSASFLATYGKPPDFELVPTAHDAVDDPSIANLRSAEEGGSSIGSSASLTDGGEPVILYRLGGGALVADVDYVFYGAPSASNPVVDKTAISAGGGTYRDDTSAASQSAARSPATSSGLHRCDYTEPGERLSGGNGLLGHDETSERVDRAFVSGASPQDRTPGGPPPLALCRAALAADAAAPAVNPP